MNHVYHYLKGCHCDSFCLEYHCILLFSVQGTSVPSEHLGLYICTEMSPSGDFLDHPVWRGTCYFLSLNFAFYFHDICVKFKAMAPHSSTLAWKIPWMEEPGRLWSMGSLRVGHGWVILLWLFTFHALEKEMATHSSVLAWRIPGTGDPGGLPSMGSHSVKHDWSDLAAAAATKWLYPLLHSRWTETTFDLFISDTISQHHSV